MTNAHTAIASAAIAWATARRDHWALVQATYADTGLPSKPDAAVLMANERRMDEATRRLHALALTQAGEREPVVVGARQMAMTLEESC